MENIDHWRVIDVLPEIFGIISTMHCALNCVIDVAPNNIYSCIGACANMQIVELSSENESSRIQVMNEKLTSLMTLSVVTKTSRAAAILLAHTLLTFFTVLPKSTHISGLLIPHQILHLGVLSDHFVQLTQCILRANRLILL
jgi:hypothetical protein